MLLHKVREGNEAALSRLMCANMRFVVGIAQHYSGHGVSADDLIAAGNEGLLISVRRFNCARNVKLISYSVWWIRNRILRAIATQSRAMIIPEHLSTVVLPGIHRMQARMLQNSNRQYSIDELAVHYNTNRKRMLDITALTGTVRSLNQCMYYSQGESPLDAVTYSDVVDKEGSYPDFEAPDASADAASLLDFVHTLLAQCSAREARIIRMYFGIDGEYPHTLGQIGRSIGVTRERTRQILAKRFRRFREKYRSRADIFAAL
jgi:RNA polymerase primary sigma factor